MQNEPNHAAQAGEQPAFLLDERGLLAAAFVAFLGIAYVGPALARLRRQTRDTVRQARDRTRRIGAKLSAR